MFDAHVVDDQQVAFEIALERPGVVLQFQFEQLGDHVEDGTIEHGFAALDQFVTEGLSQVAFTHAGRADEEQIVLFIEEAPGGQLVDPGSVDLVEAEVEALQAALIAESCGFDTALYGALLSQVDFVLEEGFEEGFMGQLMPPGFLQSQLQVLVHAAEAEFFEVLSYRFIHKQLKQMLGGQVAFVAVHGTDERVVL